jgi:hypothetical protein
VPGPEPDFLAILTCLAEHGAEFVVVGGIAAVLQGAPIATFDLDVVHARTAANVTKLLGALHNLGARYRGERALRPDASHLTSAGHQLLLTRFGPLDLLGEIGASHGYDDLVAHSVWLDLPGDLRVRVLDLSWVIRTKEETGQEKDAATLAILRRTLEQM